MTKAYEVDNSYFMISYQPHKFHYIKGVDKYFIIDEQMTKAERAKRIKEGKRKAAEARENAAKIQDRPSAASENIFQQGATQAPRTFPRFPIATKSVTYWSDGSVSRNNETYAKPDWACR